VSWSHIVIHHSLTKDSGSVSWGAIRKYHVEVNKWKDIGYHFGVELVGDGYEVLVGRPETSEGAACYQQGMNKRGIQVCCVGDYDSVAPPDKMLEILVDRLLIPLCFRYSIVPANIQGHEVYATYKSCPGKLFDMDKLRGLVWNRLKA
jgi:N-acetylmuramoyl-L-alanine amidase